MDKVVRRTAADVSSQGSKGLSRAAAEMLFDLVDNKMGCLEVWDRDDERELKTLARARSELAALLGRPAGMAPGPALGRIVPTSSRDSRRAAMLA
jgi:hypothetical protein